MSKLKWWQTGVFYQIYPRSFFDGNGDGIGDFQGITEKLDTISSLGIDAIWLSPHFPSPMWDCGYDISDYEAVAPEYGSVQDFMIFLEAAHQKNLHVILDLVLNHTSNEHLWFKESSSNRDNPKANWYIWEDTPPNNWQSCFDGDAWTYVQERNQYYYHYFMRQQPDLNWHNPDVKAAMWKAVRFWLDMGVDGFRLDAIGTIFEHPDQPNHKVPMNLAELRHFGMIANTPQEKRLVKKYWREMFKYQLGQPHQLMKELKCILAEYPGDRMLVGEDDNIAYLGDGNNELDLVFNFPLMQTRQITPAWVRKNQACRLDALSRISPDAWPCNTLGNHDSSRVHNRYGDGEHDAELARLNATMILTLRGTPFLYNGEEIGMTDLEIEEPSLLRDTMATWFYQTQLDEFGIPQSEAADRAAKMSRDKNRTPMQWDRSPNAGFCPQAISPWLPVNPNFTQGVNVKDQEIEPHSLLNFYRQIISLRRTNPGLSEGDYQLLLPCSRNCLAFLRTCEKQSILVVLNYSENPTVLKFPSIIKDTTLLTLFTSVCRIPVSENTARLHIGPYEIYIAELVE